ncbi:hypothetical protein ACP70R_002159 [Stipagrostis hirtigluma subsp. patula]
MMRSRLALVVAVLLAAAAALPAGADAAWTPIRNPRALVIQQVGNFAVIVYSIPYRKVKVLQLVSVVSGETQPVGDGTTDYRLVLNVRDNAVGTTALFQCVVRGRPGSRSNTWKLLSFKPYKQ